MTFGRNAGIAFALLMFAGLPLATVQAAETGYDWGTTYIEPNYYDYGSTYIEPNYYDYGSTYIEPNYYDWGSTYIEPNYYDYGSTYIEPYEYDWGSTYIEPDYVDYGSTYLEANSYASASASAYAYASSYSYGDSYSYNYDNDHGCKKNCNPPQPKPKPVCALDISPSQVDYGGDAEIHWTSENATSASLTGFGSVSTGGSREIENIKNDKTYTLTVTGPGGSATCSDHIEAEEEEEDFECKLRASDRTIERGDSVKISWESEGADRGRISPTIGDVDEEGSETVRPRSDTTYKGTFYNDDGDKVTCSVEVEVEDYPVYIPPQTPYVTLSAVPYTGFELGPVGTAVYWSLLVLWCLIAAYLIAVKKAHYALARGMKNFLFGRGEVVVRTTSYSVTQAPRGTVHTAPAAHLDSTDEFVLSQIHRSN